MKPVLGVAVLTSTDVAYKTFRVAIRGYSAKEVDVFLDRVIGTLREYEAGKQGELNPQDVDQQIFRVELRGYNQGEVDEFLDEVVETLRDRQRRMIEELTPPVSAAAVAREGPGPPAAHPQASVPALPEPSQPVTVESTTPQPAPTPAPASTITRLTITRTAERGGRPYTVLLDDQPIGKVPPGATERFEIPTGMHWVTVKTRKDQSNNVVIESHQGDQITLRCGPAAGEIDDLGRRMEGIILEPAG